MPMFRKLFLLPLLLIIAGATGFSQNVIITGNLPGAEGETISLYAYDDYVSGHMALLQIDTIAVDASFSFSVPVRQIREFVVECRFKKDYFFVLPKASYVLEADTFIYNDRYNYFLHEKNIGFRIHEDLAEWPINASVRDFSIAKSDYIANHLKGIFRDRNSLFLDSLKMITDSLPDFNSDYLNAFRDYSLADVITQSRSRKRAEIFEKFIDGQTIRYSNPAYMDFFKGFFDKFLLTGSKNYGQGVLKVPINENHDFQALMDTLGRDSMLRNEKIRELVFLCNFSELYQHPLFNKEALQMIAQQMIEQSDFPEHRLIMTNVLRKLQRFEPGQKAPELNGFDCSGNPLSLSDFHSKYIVIAFLKNWCQKCLMDLGLISKMIEKQEGRIKLLVVSADQNDSDFKWLCSKYGEQYPLLYIGDDVSMIHDWAVHNYPLYALIDTSGNIIQYPAKAPLQGMEAELSKIMRVLNQKDRDEKAKKREFRPEGFEKY